MKNTLIVLIALVAFSLNAQVPPFLRNRFTTNADLFINAGPGLTITTNNGSNFTFSVASTPFNSTNLVLWTEATGLSSALMTNSGVATPGIRFHNSAENNAAGGLITFYNGDYANFWSIQPSTNYFNIVDFTIPFLTHQRNSNRLFLSSATGSALFGTNVGPANPNAGPPGNFRVGITDYLQSTNDLFAIYKHNTNVFKIGSNGYPRMVIPGSGDLIAIESSTGNLFRTNASGGSGIATSSGSGTNTFLYQANLIGDLADETIPAVQLSNVNGGIDIKLFAEDPATGKAAALGSIAIDTSTPGFYAKIGAALEDWGQVFVSDTARRLNVGGGATAGTIRVWDAPNGQYLTAVAAGDNSVGFGLLTAQIRSEDAGSPVVYVNTGDFAVGGGFRIYATNANGGFSAGTNNLRVSALGEAQQRAIGTYSTNFTVAVANTAGATNTTHRTEVWNVFGTSGTIRFYNRTGADGGTPAASLAVWTNTVSTTGVDYIVGPNQGLQFVSGVGTVLARRVF